jgi:hypothetical protein
LTNKFIISCAPYKDQTIELKELCPLKFFKISPLPLFSPEATSFLNELSESILKKTEIRDFPELLALAFWLRKGNLVPLLKNWKSKLSSEELLSARGVAFHIAPSNVDSIFLYSWALSLLCGNLNVVRVSSTRSIQLDILFEIIDNLFNTHKQIAIRNKLFTYQHDDEISTYFSINADLRVLWGGDETVNLIKNLKSKPTVKDVTFADKSSLAIIDSNSYMRLNNNERDKLAHAFYNDTYWFDQKACSSPSRIYFIGSNADKSSEIFWNYMSKELTKNKALDDVSLSIKKLTSLYQEIIDHKGLEPLIIGRYDRPTVLLQKSGPPVHPSCGGGFFIEGRLANLNELPKVVMRKDQTLGYFGFNSDDLRELSKTSIGFDLDRIVPIGSALDFHHVWDGYDLLTEFSKRLIFF